MSLRVYHKNLQELSYLSTIQFDCMKVALFKYENNKVQVQLWISEYHIQVYKLHGSYIAIITVKTANH